MLKGMIIHIVIAFSSFISQFGLLLIGNFTNFKQVVLEISLRQTTNFKNNSIIKSSILFVYTASLYWTKRPDVLDFVDAKPENYFAIWNEKTTQIQDTKATPTVSIREVRIKLKSLSAISCIEKWRLRKSHSSSYFGLELIFGNIEVTTNKSRKRITGSSERQTFSEINWDWFLCFKYISRSFSFLKSSRVIIYHQLPFFNTSKRWIPIVHLSHDLI